MIFNTAEIDEKYFYKGWLIWKNAGPFIIAWKTNYETQETEELSWESL